MGKNYKKFLIDLFESQVESIEIQEEYFQDKYHLTVEFNSDLGAGELNAQDTNDDDFYMRKTHSKNCKMFLLYEKETFYLCFNSIKTEISFTEYKRLNNKITHKRQKHLEDIKNKTNKRNEKLLNEVFSNFTKKQERKILFEKNND